MRFSEGRHNYNGCAIDHTGRKAGQMYYGEGTVLPERYYERREIAPGVYRMIVMEGETVIFDDIISDDDERVG